MTIKAVILLVRSLLYKQVDGQYYVQQHNIVSYYVKYKTMDQFTDDGF